MRDSGRLSAAIAVLEDFERRRVPLKIALADWARGARYAGAKDRAWISGLCLDVLRRRRSLAAAMGDERARAAVIAALRWAWGRSVEDIAAIAGEAPHGPGALSEVEREALSSPSPVLYGRGASGEGPSNRSAPIADGPSPPTPLAQAGEGSLSILGDFPDWLQPSVERVFGGDALGEMKAFAERADVDLRLNTLKTSPERALHALETIGAAAHPLIRTAARIAAPDAAERAPAVTVIPAFNKGWIEVQDLGSQIATLAAGAVKGAQVLDYCAGGGGKTLALAALMENTGQLYAYDEDARRLAPLYERARRAGVRNLQIIDPTADKEALGRLSGKMDVVFVDAPCTGCGTWRRHPDAKWRLTAEQLQRRLDEQDTVLREGAAFAKPGGRLAYVTCSFLMEENEDRLAAFLSNHRHFAPERALDLISASSLLGEEGRAALARCEASNGALRMTPSRVGADGFFVGVLRRAG